MKRLLHLKIEMLLIYEKQLETYMLNILKVFSLKANEMSWIFQL
jgi:hypothetical protein